MKLAAFALVLVLSCGPRAPAASQIDTSLYEYQLTRAVNQARTCQEALQNVADVRAVWLVTWPDAPMPALTCPDGGTPHVDASTDRE